MLKAVQDVYGSDRVQFEIPPSGNLLIDQSYRMDYIYWQIAFKRLFIETLQRGERNTLQGVELLSGLDLFAPES